MRLRTRAFALMALALAGCAALQEPLRSHLGSGVPDVRGCADWYLALDAETEAAGVRDAQERRIAGFPYLRVNRLLASFRPDAAAREAALQALADGMRALDVEARRHELANLPDERLRALPGPPELAVRGAAQHHTRECGRLLRDIDLAQPEQRSLLLERARVPDDYRFSSRLFGLYALTRHAFAAGVRRWEDEVRAAFSRELAAAPGSVVLRYAPQPAPPLAHAGVAAMLADASRNPLGIPELAERELEALFAAHAPSFEIEVGGDHDRFGALRWLHGEAVPAVDASRQVVYRHAAATRYRGQVLLQLVYAIWFPQRPPADGFDILSGLLDGVVWRVTLAPDGEPLVYDTMHPCGCFHMFFPTPRATPLPPPDELEEWLLVPQQLTRVEPGERPVLRIATRTHYVERVTLVRGNDSLARYELRPYGELRSLGRLDGAAASVFGPDGLIAGSERAERFFFWPMGIASAGTMRQWGRHATAFVGRRHFDDPDLLEKRFKLDLP